jgi:hypothetical protein
MYFFPLTVIVTCTSFGSPFIKKCTGGVVEVCVGLYLERSTCVVNEVVK